MRIYEYAKKNNMTSKELLEILEKKGFDVASHMSVIVPEALEFLDKKFSKEAKKSVPEKVAPKAPQYADKPASSAVVA